MAIVNCIGLVTLLWTYCPLQAQPSRIPVHTTILDNGLRVVFRECPASATAACSVFVRVSAVDESSLTAGIRELIQLMIAAPAGIGSDEIESQEPVSIQTEGSTTRDYVALTMHCLPTDLPAALPSLRRRLFDSEFTASQFQIARRRLLRSLAAGDEMPIPLSLNTLVRRLYPAQRGSWPLHGTFAAVGALKLDDVRSFYQSRFLPNATTIAVAGPLSWETVRAMLKETFETLLPGSVNSQPPPFSPPTNLPGCWRGAIPGGNTSVVVLGGEAPTLTSPDYPAAAVLTTLLGSGMGSRLYQTLRNEQALVYTLAAELTPSQVCSYAYILATCSPADVDTVQQLISEQLQDIAERGPSPEEMQRAKRYLRGSFALNQQSTRDLTHYLGMFTVCGESKGLTIYQQFPNLISTVSRADVQQVCQKIFGSPAIVILQASGSTQIPPSGQTECVSNSLINTEVV